MPVRAIATSGASLLLVGGLLATATVARAPGNNAVRQVARAVASVPARLPLDAGVGARYTIMPVAANAPAMFMITNIEKPTPRPSTILA